jgi:hypothetical protein
VVWMHGYVLVQKKTADAGNKQINIQIFSRESGSVRTDTSTPNQLEDCCTGVCSDILG